MIADHPMHDFAMSAERVKGAFLVKFHQPAVAGDIGGQDRCELAFHSRLPWQGRRFDCKS
jgi:hypothetical protein